MRRALSGENRMRSSAVVGNSVTLFPLIAGNEKIPCRYYIISYLADADSLFHESVRKGFRALGKDDIVALSVLGLYERASSPTSFLVLFRTLP
jgi:hypothetical protein